MVTSAMRPSPTPNVVADRAVQRRHQPDRHVVQRRQDDEHHHAVDPVRRPPPLPMPGRLQVAPDGDRRNGRGLPAGLPGQPLGERLPRWQPAHLDLGQAAPGPGHGRVQPREVLVGGDRDQHVTALAEQPVGEVEQPGQRLTGGLLGLGPDQLVAVLQDEQPPAALLLVVVRRRPR